MYSGGDNVLEFATSGRKAISLNSSTLIFYQDADPYGATITFYRSTGNVSTIGNVSASGYVLGAAGIAVGVIATDNRIDDASNGSGSTTLYIGNETITTSSDKRIKKDITSFTGYGLDLTSQLPVKEFAWDDPSDTQGSKNERGKYMGFIAQEVADIVPWAVNTQGGKDCENCKAGNECEEHPIPWLLNYSYIVPVLVKAVQELTEKVKRLEEGN